MFEGLKNLANVASVARQTGEMQKRMNELTERVGRMEVSGTAGGDAVTVRMSGDFQVRSVQIHQWLVEARNQELLQQLSQEAFNTAIQKTRDLTTAEMARLAEDLNIPGVQDALNKMGDR